MPPRAAAALLALAAVASTASATAVARGGAASTEGPCDIYGAAGTPCVAAHSVVRALYGAYTGPLYRVTRTRDNATADVGLLAPGGFADIGPQDALCGAGDCVISVIYDQSPRGNHLTPAPAGGHVHTPDAPVNASRLRITAGGGIPVIGAVFEGGMGYRVDDTSGVATGNDPETLYMVASGSHYNGRCCFDYGNAERNNRDNGAGTMEAVYWGNSTTTGRGGGRGPWVMADLESGLWPGAQHANANNTPVLAAYVTAMVKGGTNGFALKSGDAADAAGLRTQYEGPRPAGYQPMKKEGAIILGIGGDNSNESIGTFFEGVITAGYSSDAADAAVQANIAAARYGR